MKLFLDSSVLLAAAGSISGASRFVIDNRSVHGWELVSADYCSEETGRNLLKLKTAAWTAWVKNILPKLQLVSVQLALDKPLVFIKTKDRPVVISALAENCDWLLTFDETDFQEKLGPQIYGMRISTPGAFLMEQRRIGGI